jgi:dehydrogenase/reductase SDR family protein 12
VRANTAQDEIHAAADSLGFIAGSTGVVIADVGLREEVQNAASLILASEPGGIDGLICNAGVLLNDRELTAEGFEVTFATHFLFGSFLLTKLLWPGLHAAGAAGREPRVVMVSSGGMYNVAFPAWDVAASTPGKDGEVPEYNGQLAYAYAKRGQVLLCEHWSEMELKAQGAGSRITFVSAHPGWTSTAAVLQAYGETAKWLEPMRTTWQGAEGICWLCATPTPLLKPGAFYLDREPQTKHLAGPFFTEGWFTKNTVEEVDAMILAAERMVDLKAES